MTSGSWNFGPNTDSVKTVDELGKKLLDFMVTDAQDMKQVN